MEGVKLNHLPAAFEETDVKVESCKKRERGEKLYADRHLQRDNWRLLERLCENSTRWV